VPIRAVASERIISGGFRDFKLKDFLINKLVGF
jgi:hypothetical protein